MSQEEHGGEGEGEGEASYRPLSGTHLEDAKAGKKKWADEKPKDPFKLRTRQIHAKFNRAIDWITYAEVTAYILAGCAFTFMALVVLYRGVDDIYQILVSGTLSQPASTTRIVDALSEFLFVIILMELLATVITHIRHESFQIKPFIIIGIISGVRQILLIGARLSLNESMSDLAWKHSQIELGVNVGIDAVLVLCLVFLKRYRVED